MKDRTQLAVVTYNVKGVPKMLQGDDQRGRMRAIGARLNRYDCALLQEDWTYHEALRSRTDHPYLVRPNRGSIGRFDFFRALLRAGWVSGLTILLRSKPLACHAEPFRDCSGWLSKKHDCLVPDGFLMTRVAVLPSVELDLYSLHLDTGRHEQDHQARVGQIAQLSRYLERASCRRPLILGGDFNLLSQCRRDQQLLQAFARALRLFSTDAGRSLSPQRLYLFYRSSSTTRLTVDWSGKDDAFTGLSDHAALATVFSITRS